MRWLLFLSRVAFLCGITMVFAFASLFVPQIEQYKTIASIFLAGYVLSLVLLPLTVLLYILSTLFRKNIRSVIPAWLIIINILFFITLILYIFYINDPYYITQ